jgi:hypothetical protein
MWFVRDDVAVTVARNFYGELVKSGAISGTTSILRHRDVAQALHTAVRALWKDGSGRSDDVLAWAPYFHIGA